ncbi:MAG: FecR domain-containing protein [Planctomycetes bacterium]|nr:FecR domain-containing protein [Planctomycetota bacterium]
MLLLEDGTIVALEEGTELSLYEVSNVPISLYKGEALLEVTKRATGEIPFIVQTQDSVITVLGTIFSVRVNKTNTRLDVYEGKVQLQRTKDNRSTEVGENQFLHSNDPALKVSHEQQQDTNIPINTVIEVLPTDDAYIENNRKYNNRNLKVEGGKRDIYLRFEVNSVGPIQKAILQLTQDIDIGQGTLRFYAGSHSGWSENSLGRDGAPRKKELITKRKGGVYRKETISVDLSSHIKGDGAYTIIVSLDEALARDIWFSSKEGPAPPKLLLTPAENSL